MDIRKLYRNPEIKKVTFKFIIILIIGIVVAFGLSFGIVKKINRTLVNQNTIIMAEVIKDGDKTNIIKDFNEFVSEEDLQSARDLLKSYGYDEDFQFRTNEITNEFFKDMLIIFIPMVIVFTLLLYLIFTRELSSMYKRIGDVVSNITMGDFKKIDGVYEEGELAILANSINYMGERANNSIVMLEEEREKLKAYLEDISHQLKTPLSSLVMFNDLMRENENMPYKDRIKFLDKCEEQLSRMEWLIMNLLKVGRLEAGVINFNREVQPLRDTIELAISSLIGEAERKNQRLLLEGELDAEIIHDRDWLSEGISNIVKNAIEHTGEGGTIKIKVDKGPIITKINIIDNGPGIPKEMQDKVFKRFYKGEASINPKSIGIGLYISNSIVKELGGEIKLISEVGKGTTFSISFMDKLR